MEERIVNAYNIITKSRKQLQGMFDCVEVYYFVHLQQHHSQTEIPIPFFCLWVHKKKIIVGFIEDKKEFSDNRKTFKRQRNKNDRAYHFWKRYAK